MSVADDLAIYLSRWDVTGDLQVYATAIGQMFSEVETYAADTDITIGWQPLWDVDIAPTAALPWLAMVVGESVPQGSTDAQARALIRAAPNQDRGSPDAIATAVKQTLTGGQLVGIKERWRTDTNAEDDDCMSIFTYSSQTPSVGAVQAALRRTVPADIDIFYSVQSGPTWAAVESAAGSGSWSNLYTHFGAGAWTVIEGSVLALPGYAIY